MTQSDTKTTSRVDLHCHSSASAVAKLGVQNALGLPECATPPEEVHALAKRRGMDFVTITDHDTIGGVLAIADRPDVFVSEELTVAFRGEPQQVHVLCLGITPGDHEWLQAHRHDVEARRRLPARARDRLRARAPVLRGRGAAHRPPPPPARRAVRGSGRSATAPATPSSRRRRRSTSRRTAARASAAPTITRGSTSAARGPRRRTPRRRRSSSPTCPRQAPCEARGDEGSAARWAHNAMALAVRALGAAPPARRDPAAVLRMAERVMTDAEGRAAAARPPTWAPGTRAGCCRPGSRAVELDPASAGGLVTASLADGDLIALPAGRRVLARGPAPARPALPRAQARGGRSSGSRRRPAAPPVSSREAAFELFEACVPRDPLRAGRRVPRPREAPAGRARAGSPCAWRSSPTAWGSMHGVTRTLDEIRERGVPGLRGRGGRHRSARRPPPPPPWPSSTSRSTPGCASACRPSPRSSTRSPRGATSWLHVCAPGAGRRGGARPAGTCSGCRSPARCHTELAAYAGAALGDPRVDAGDAARAGRVLRPLRRRPLPRPRRRTRALAELGVAAGAGSARWDRGVDTGALLGRRGARPDASRPTASPSSTRAG